MPHHVQHPEKYTCYILDEPLVVGGGDKGSGTDSQADQVKVSPALSMQYQQSAADAAAKQCATLRLSSATLTWKAEAL